MKRKRSQERLGHRERQLMDAIYQLGEASVSDVLRLLSDPPSYSAVRKMLNVLEDKGFLKHRSEGTKYIYRPTRSPEVASKQAIKQLVRTFFRGSAPDAVNAILDVTASKLSDDDFARLRAIIDQAEQEGQ